MAVDRCYLLFLSGVDKGNGADQYCVGSAYEWCLRGIEPSAQQMVGTLWSDLPWMLQRLFEGEIVRFDSVADVPSEADAERKLLDRNHVQSMLVIPLMQGGQLKGCFGVSMVRLRLLRLVGEVLFNAVARRQAEEALRGSEQKFRALAYENAGLLEQASKDAATKSTLLKEVNHRVKNNLTGIIGLLYAEQVRGSAKEVEGRSAILEEMTCRIQGMATVHSMLTATEWAPLSLDELVERVIRGTQQIASRRKQVFVNVPPCSVEVTPDEAHSLSMVINELATNSLKYATGEGISVSIEVQIAVENGTIHLLFRDDGEGYPASVLKDEHDSLGLYLVQNIVGRELSGQVEFATDRGAVTSIRFPSGVQKAAAQEV